MKTDKYTAIEQESNLGYSTSEFIHQLILKGVISIEKLKNFLQSKIKSNDNRMILCGFYILLSFVFIIAQLPIHTNLFVAIIFKLFWIINLLVGVKIANLLVETEKK